MIFTWKDTNNDCEPCGFDCLTCKSEAKFCLTCKKSSELQVILKNNVCVPMKDEECLSGSYFDIVKNRCESCDKSCASCSANSRETCSKCADKNLLLQEGKCVEKCGDGFFKSLSENRCLNCHKNCATCNDRENCLTCKSGYEMQGWLKKSGICEQFVSTANCDTNCLECTTNRKCLVCKNGL